MRLFSDGSLDPELQDAVTAVRVVRRLTTHFLKPFCTMKRYGTCSRLTPCVVAVQVRDRQTNIGKGIAFVEFKTKAAAAAAMRLAEPKLHGRPLRISFLKQPKASAIAAAESLPVVAKPGEDLLFGLHKEWCLQRKLSIRCYRA